MTATGPYQVMPPLSAYERAALAADIHAHGVLVPVEYDEVGEILDGYHRVAICRQLGISDWPKIVRPGLSTAEKLSHARRLNLARRHLSSAQKRSLIAAELSAAPEASNRAIGDRLGVDSHTVADVRARLLRETTLPDIRRRVGRDGRTRQMPHRRPSGQVSLFDELRVNTRPIGAVAIGQCLAMAAELEELARILRLAHQRVASNSTSTTLREAISERAFELLVAKARENVA